ncbi:MAG: hypothetical protein LBK47_10595 [Prevotellaceae bacterium]|nr:hypothetical protein [Prevotellaceae bacterium]
MSFFWVIFLSSFNLQRAVGCSLLWLLLGCIAVMQGCATVSYGAFAYNVNGEKSYINLGKESLLWDTGSSSSLFFLPPRAHKICVGVAATYDCERTRYLRPFWFSPRISAAGITVKNMRYCLVPQSETPATIKDGHSGIMGMNVIKRAGWLVDFSQKTIQIIPRGNAIPVKQLPVLSLPYRRPKYPCTTLIVQGVKVENVLMDTGAAGDLYLPKAALEQLHRNIQPVDSAAGMSTCLYTDSIPRKVYRYSNITVCGRLFSTLTIRESGSASVGMGFFERFNRLYLDTEKRELQLYVCVENKEQGKNKDGDHAYLNGKGL